MSDRDWLEAKRNVLSRIFDAAFGRHEALSPEIRPGIFGLRRGLSDGAGLVPEPSVSHGNAVARD
jgi:hypothetical protein